MDLDVSVTDLEVTVEEKAANEPLEKIIKHFDTIASWKGGCCLLDGLAPCTEYSLVMRTLTDAGVTGPLSGPRLRFITKARVPDFPAMMRVDSVTDTLIIFSWDAPRDFGSAIEMYEVEYRDTFFHRTFVEYHDTFFHRTFVSLVNWNCRNLATRTILFSPATDDPLADGLQIAERPSVLLPSTLVHARLRARNPAGWSEWGHPDMRLLATSPDTLDFAWMPPVIANSRAGIVGYRLDLTIVLSEAGGTVTRREDVSVDTLNGERLKFRFNHRPVTSKQYHPFHYTRLV
ncbi:hypothetical protein T484DRAFT_1788599 [Baffinella frigidus]|nr:hypothetical protein T484DRAFT_1788599 [Cryptophyta sp. CCMP2293]